MCSLTKRGFVMAAVVLIMSSILGAICAVLALSAGALASTALLVFVATSLGISGTLLFLASQNTHLHS